MIQNYETKIAGRRVRGRDGVGEQYGDEGADLGSGICGVQLSSLGGIV